MCGRDEEDQPHVGYGSLRVNEDLKAQRENNRSPPAGAFAAGPASPAIQQHCGQRSCDRRRKTRREIILAEDGIARDLRPINQRRFIEAILAIEKRNNVIASLAHFAGSFGKTGLVPIDERNGPCPGDVEKKGAEENDDEIADCEWQSRDSKIGPGERQTRISSAPRFALVVSPLRRRCNPDPGELLSRCECAELGSPASKQQRAKFHAGREPIRRLAGTRRARTAPARNFLLAREQTLDANLCRNVNRVRAGRSFRPGRQDRDRALTA